LFNPEVDYVDFNMAGFDNRDPDAKGLRDEDFARFLERYVYRPDAGVVTGFKLLYAHVWGTPGLLDYLVSDLPLRVVHLKRRNQLRVLVSTRLAERTGVWQVDRGFAPDQLRSARLWTRALRRPGRAIAALRKWLRQPPAASDKEALILTVDECVQFFVRAAHEEEHFSRLFADHPAHELFYEDLAGDRDRTLRRIHEFLGLAPERSTVTLQRQNPEPLEELIANYDELRRAFAGTPQERFFV
jgi:hypothetical protein